MIPSPSAQGLVIRRSSADIIVKPDVTPASVPLATNTTTCPVAVAELFRSRYVTKTPQKTPISHGVSRIATQFSTADDTSATNDAALATRKLLFDSKQRARRRELPWITKQSTYAVRPAGVYSIAVLTTVLRCVIEGHVGLVLRLSLRISRVLVVGPSSELLCLAGRNHLPVSLTAQGLRLAVILE